MNPLDLINKVLETLDNLKDLLSGSGGLKASIEHLEKDVGGLALRVILLQQDILNLRERVTKLEAQQHASETVKLEISLPAAVALKLLEKK